MIPILNCTTAVGQTLPQIIWCALTMACGGELVTILLLFCIFLYAMHVGRIPAIPSVMIGLTMLFVFNSVGGIQAFETMIYVSLFAIGAMIAMFFWGFAKK